jgi:Icc-related predicted phosphoesterase
MRRGVENFVSFRLAKSADWHVRLSGSELSRGMIPHVVNSMGNENPDAALIAGDMTDNGVLEVTRIVARGLRPLSDANIPVFATFGNHDYPKDRDIERTRKRMVEQKKIYEQLGGVKILDGTSDVIRKRVHGKSYSLRVFGMTGGYDGSFFAKEEGEEIVVPDIRGQDLTNSLDKLKRFLENTNYNNNIILMHFAPLGEMLTRFRTGGAIVAGSNLFAETIGKYQDIVNAVFHGHVHNGLRYGKIGSVDVTNVAMHIGVYQAENARRQLKPHDYYHVSEVVHR